jgi:predicted transport protein
LALYLKLEPTADVLKEPNTRDVRTIGHWGTGNLEVSIRNMSDFERAKQLMQKAYAGS